MKLGLSIGYSGAHLEVPVALVQRAAEVRAAVGQCVQLPGVAHDHHGGAAGVDEPRLLVAQRIGREHVGPAFEQLRTRR